MKKIALYTTLSIILFLSLNVSFYQDKETNELIHTVGIGTEEVSANIIRSSICAAAPFLCPVARAIETGSEVAVDTAAEKVTNAAVAGLKEIVDPLLRGIANVIMWFASWIAWLGGAFLNMTIQITVVHMSALINGMPAIDVGWAIFRDLANIAFIFILLYIAIATILELGLNTRKTLVRVIVAALLINFSLFFAKVIVDTSNILTINLYNQIAEQVPEGTINDIDNGISGVLYEKLKLTSVYDVEEAKIRSDAVGRTAAEFSITSGGNIFAYFPRVVGGAIILVTAGIILFAAAFMFLLRFVIIVFLFITAPIAFAAMILPKTAGVSKKWWSSLTDQAIFAPTFMLLMLITIGIADSLNRATQSLVIVGVGDGISGGIASALLSGSATQIAPLVTTFIVFAFLIGTLVLSKKAGGTGGD